MGSLNFGKDTAEDKYAAFLLEYDEYKNDDLSIYKAQCVATSAWHVCLAFSRLDIRKS